MPKKMFSRGVSIVVVWAFITMNTAFALNNAPAQRPGNLLAPRIGVDDILKIAIPSGWGIIKDSYNSGTDKLIINIQDTHCDSEAQQNISRILDRLAMQYQLRLVALEGASGSVDNPLLSNFPDKDIGKEVSACLVREGKLTGAEFFAVTSDYGVKLYGVEDGRLYLDNLDAFRQSQPFKKDALTYLNVVKQALDSIKDYVYNDDLKKLDRIEAGYAGGKVPFDQYSQALFTMLGEHNLARVNYPTFYELQRVIELEQKVDFRKADVERSRLILDLTESINNKDDIAALVENSLNYKKGLLSSGEFASFLKDLAFGIKLTLISYPNFNAYADYITKYEKVANEKLFHELTQLRQDLRNALYTDDIQKQLDTLYKNLDAMNKLVNLQMLNEDMSYFSVHREEMNVDAFRKFIEPLAYAHKVSVNLPPELSYIDVYIPAWAKFYEFAAMRDAAMINNTLQRMDAENTDYAALITGGFHTEKLTQLLKAKKISYLVIAPRASASEDNPYMAIMQGGGGPLDKFIKQLSSTLQTNIGIDMQQQDNFTPDEKAQAAELKANKFESQIGTLIIASVLKHVSAEGEVNKDMIKTEVRQQVDDTFDVVINKTQDANDKELLSDMKGRVGDIVDNLVNEMIQVTEGTVTVNVGLGNVLVYNPQKTEGNKISIAAKSELGTSSGETMLAAVAKETTGAEEQLPETADALLQNMTAGMSAPAKARIIQALSTVVDTLGKGLSKVGKVAKELYNKLLALGVNSDQAQQFTAMMSPAADAASAPITQQAADLVVQATGLDKVSDTSAARSAVQTGIASILNAPSDKREAAIGALFNTLDLKNKYNISITEEGFSAIVDESITKAALISNSGVVAAKDNVVSILKLDSEQAQAAGPVMLTGIAEIKAAATPQEKTEATARLAAAMSETLGTNVAANLLDAAFRKADIAANPATEEAGIQIIAELGLSDQAEAVLPVVQSGIADVLMSTPETKSGAIQQLADAINAKLGKNVVTAERLTGMVDNNVQQAYLASSPEIAAVAGNIKEEFTLGESALPQLQSGIAKIMLLPAGEQKAAIVQLAATMKNFNGEVNEADLVDALTSATTLDGATPLVTQVTALVVQDLETSGISLNPEQKTALQSVVAGYINAAPQEKLNTPGLQDLSSQIGVKADALGGNISAQLTTASVAVSGDITRAAQQVAADPAVGLSGNPDGVLMLARGIALIQSAAPENRAAAIGQLAETINTTTGAVIETAALDNLVTGALNNTSSADSAKSTAMAAQYVVSALQLSETQVAVVESYVAEIRAAETPQQKSDAVNNLTAALDKSLGSSAVAKLVDTAIRKADIAANPAIQKAAEQITEAVFSKLPAKQQAAMKEQGVTQQVSVTVRDGITEMLMYNLEDKMTTIQQLGNKINLIVGVSIAHADTFPDIVTSNVEQAFADSPVTKEAAKTAATDLNRGKDAWAGLQNCIGSLMVSSTTEYNKVLQASAKELGIVEGVLNNTVRVAANKVSIANSAEVAQAADTISENLGLKGEKKAQAIPRLQVAIAEVLLAATDEQRTAAVDNLVDTGSQLDVTKKTSADIKALVVTAIPASSVTTAAANTVPAQVAGQLTSAVDNAKAQLLAVNIAPGAVAAQKKNTPASWFVKGETAISALRNAVTKSGGDVNNTVIVLGEEVPGQAAAEVSVSVKRVGGTDYIRITPVTVKNDSVLEGANKTINTFKAEHSGFAMIDEAGLMASAVGTQTIGEAATDIPEAEAEVVGRITNLQGKNKFIVIDEKFFYSLVTKAGGGADGVEIAVNAVFSPDIIQNLKQGNIGLIIKQNSGLVSTDGSGKEIKVDLHSFMANVLQKMGVPENSFLIFDAKTAAVVQNSSEPVPVTWDSVKQGLQRQFGDNIHVHAIAPEADTDEMKNLKKSNQDSVTYTTFTEFGENSTALRIGDAFITEALKTMILGTNKQLTDSDKQALAGAILATINVDMTKVGGRKGLADIMGKKLNSLEDPDTKTVNLDKAIVAWVAPEKWA